MRKITFFFTTSLFFSLILGCLSSLFTKNEDFLTLAYSFGVFLAVIAFGGLRKINLGDVKRFYWWLIPISIIFLTAILITEGKFAHLPSLPKVIISSILIFIAAFFEEAGFRGYLFSLLQKTSWLRTNIIISSLWFIWHLPALFSNYYQIDNPQILTLMVYFSNFYLLGSILLWARQKSNGILFPTLIHFTINFPVIFFPVTTITLKSELIILFSTIVVLMLLGAYRNPQKLKN